MPPAILFRFVRANEAVGGRICPASAVQCTLPNLD
jgi:hypothetical protein